jgi:choline monooxygenase
MAHLHELISSYDDGLPLARAATIPADWYFDERVAALEQATVFSRNWLMAARADQLSQPGQYITIEIAGEPLLIVRGMDGVLRAFFNVCRHHAAAVATQPAGQASIFRCPYHGWSYATDGCLKGAPEFEGVLGFDRAESGLVPVRVETWEKFVFVKLDQGGPSLAEFLGGLAARVRSLHLAALEFFESRTYTLNCNWKVFVDNYLDGGYHIPHLHRGLNSVLDYTHYTIENDGRCCVQSSPMTTSSQADASTAATRQGDRAYYIWLYPNLMINWYRGAMDTNLVLPLGTDRTAVVFDFYFGGNDKTWKRESVDVSERIQNEDVAICESVQRGLKSRAYSTGRLSVRREAGEHLFHRLLAADLRSGLTRNPAEWK